jgi:hypothetical protein
MAIVAIVLVSSRGGTPEPNAATPAAVRAALISRLRGLHLRSRWVVCIRTGRTFRGRGIVRCNVNFGDPHIVAYCSMLEHGRLVTNHDTPSLECPPDLRGWRTTIFTG